MAAQTSNTTAQMSNSDTVICHQFLALYPVDLSITRKVMSLSLGNFSVTDSNGNVMFQVKPKKISLRDRRSLLDAAVNPILSFQKKVFSAHNKWLVFKGDSSDSEDIIFTARLSTLRQIKTSLDVFLGSNERDICDYKVKGSWLDRSCTIYAGESTRVIAQLRNNNVLNIDIRGKDVVTYKYSSDTLRDFDQLKIQMHKKYTVHNIAIGKDDTFDVTMNPNADHSFIVTLIVILHEINEEKDAAM